MFKKRIIFLVLLLLGLGFILYPFFSLTKKEKISQGQLVGVQASPKTTLPSGISSPMPTVNEIVPTVKTTPTPTPVPTANPTSVPTPLLPTSRRDSEGQAPTPTQSSQNQGFQVSLSINGGGSFNVNVDSGNNQCDVLTKAKDQGKIQSLNIQYDNNLGTYAVYQINGIGKENSVWWTYKVNGNSPAQGCSYIKANNGDKVEWTYIGG